MSDKCSKTKGKSRKELPVLPGSGSQKIAKSDKSRWRAAVLLGVNVLIILHIVQWLAMGTTVSPVEPSEAAFTIRDGAVNAGFIFFALALLSTLIFGRFFCGWGCHVLALQDFCAWLMKKAGIKPMPFRSRLLVYIPIIFALYMFIWPFIQRQIFLPEGAPIFPSLHNDLITTDFWETFPPIWVAIPFLFICGFVTIWFLGSKGFCTYACPYGGFFVLTDKFSRGRIRVNDDCNQCGHCTATCTSNVSVSKEVNEYGMVVDPGCMKCLDCISVCPNDALYFGFGKSAVGVEKKFSPRFSLNWTEEVAAFVLFFLSLFAVWNVYQVVPMLMALGIAAVTTVLLVKTWQFVTSKTVTLHRFRLKAGGKLFPLGIAFLTFSITWIGLVAHSGYVRYNEAGGRRVFESLRVPDELMLAERQPRSWLSAAELDEIKEGKASYYRARYAGLLTNTYAVSKLAWLEYVSGNQNKAMSLLGEATEVQEGKEKALSHYYLGTLLNKDGKHQEAIEEFDAALKLRPDLTSALEAKGQALWNLESRRQAVTVWNSALGRDPRLVVTANFLAAESEQRGDTKQAAYFENIAARSTPRDGSFLWMVGLRLEEVGFKARAERVFDVAVRLNPQLAQRRKK